MHMVYDKISLSIEKQNTTSLCFMSDLIMSTNIGIKYIATHPIIAKRKKKKKKKSSSSCLITLQC